jgi:CRISPR system Cascade subunit CasE
MYLSKVHVSWPKARDPYELHRALWTLFPGHERDQRSFLFRVEQERRGMGSEVLLQGEWQPEHAAPEIRLLATRSYQPRLRRGQALRFRLTGNPVKTIKDEKGRRNAKDEVKACRVPLVKEEQQLEWLHRKLHASARIEVASVLAIRPLYFRKGGRAGKIVTVTFDGVLEVLGPEHLWRQLQDGVGPAKGFGCGLLSIARM